MTSPEQGLVLKMVADGRVSAEEALTLLHALDRACAGAREESARAAPDPGSRVSAGEALPRVEADLEEGTRRARRWLRLPLWIGVGMSALSAALMYWVQRGSGFGLCFYGLSLPLAFGALIAVLAARGASARWLFVDVRQRPGRRPAHLTFGFPLPLRFLRWLFRAFGQRSQGASARRRLSDFVSLMERALSSEAPLILHVNDEDGEQVSLYIG